MIPGSVHHRLLYLRGLLPFPLEYKSLLGLKEEKEANELRSLSAKGFGNILISNDGYPVYISNPETVIGDYLSVLKRIGRTLSDQATIVLRSFGRTHNELFTEIIKNNRAVDLARSRKKVDKGRPPLRIEENICFLQAMVGSLLQAVFHAPHLYKGVDEEYVSNLIMDNISSISQKNPARILSEGLKDLDKHSIKITSECR